ncbi:hypothetical protein ACEWY4_001749 [Coilia grayii]|uniref:NAD(P)(+)--arginine ADP-ribosyltransferase n=1 Tax=Coilia grayii TaxID=363190 RepID=A0ABD1KTV3_9TELE
MRTFALLIITLTVLVVHVQSVDLELDMAENSVDDQFVDCEEEKMLGPTLDTYPGHDEFAESCKNQHDVNGCTALKLFTSDKMYKGKKLHKAFKQASRSGKETYISKTYEWYSLYYYLKRAVQNVKNTQAGCKQTYRGTYSKFDKNVKGKEIRLGSFTSSSLVPAVAMRFGQDSCFEIQTCYGALISQYSVFPKQEEVLIPPYEVFKVTEVYRDSSKPDFKCKTVYVLKSIGTRSNINCYLLLPTPITASLQDKK